MATPTDIYKEMERILKALANARRLAILALLKKRGEAPVYEIARDIKLSMRATSQHLSILSSRDIVAKEQRGLLVFYRLNAPSPKHAKATIDSL